MPPSSPFRGWALTLLVLLAGNAKLGAHEPSQPPAGRENAAQAAPDLAGVEFFEKQVRPLLVARCQGCHGPQKQKGNLRLDSRAAVLRGGDTGPAIVPLMADESLLVDAIRYGETYQMPPKSQLPPDEIAILVEWVRIGAPWGQHSADQAKADRTFDLKARAGHWSFQPLSDVKPPEVANASWVKTPIDRFILAGLEVAALTPAAPADKRSLLRRVTYDLIGLPPTPAEVEAFVADDSAGAYEKVVERLLGSPHYGERWARHWLDLVRYSETWGHEFDYDMANAYRYRDYVIRALNNDVPYDQFVIEHVAGDLLSEPRRHPQEGFNESIIATGSFFFGEAKHSPVDVRQDQADRIDNQIDVFGKAFLGLTVSCARCHDHKFDPISTKDYYALAGYLRSSRCQQAFIDPPQALVRPIAELKKLGEDRRKACTDFARSVLEPRLGRVAEAMLAGLQGLAGPDWTKYVSERALLQSDDVLHAWAMLVQKQPASGPVDFAQFIRSAKSRPANPVHGAKEQLKSESESAAVSFADFNAQDYGSWQTFGAAFGDAPARPWDWTFVEPGVFPGRIAPAGAAHSGLVSLKLRGVLRSPTFEIEKPRILYRLYGTGGSVRLIVDGLQIIQAPIYGGLKFEPGGSRPHWHEQDVSKWIGQRAYIEVVDDGDGYIALEKVDFTDGPPPRPALNRLVVEMLDPQSTSPAALAEKYQSLLQHVFSAWLTEPNRPPAGGEDLARIVNWVFEQLTGPELANPANDDFQSRIAAINQRQQAIENQFSPPRQAIAFADGTAENERVFIRGNYKTLGEEVSRRFLEVLGGTRHAPSERGSGRLELARQLVSTPLLRRVIVNRLWHHHLGAALVRSPDDFGAMGQKPTHPELLDYLAAELLREGWSLKRMHRLIVLSNTYQMSSQINADADRVDPQNRLWHRMAVRRLEAECIRDAMLAVSGRADATMYGPGVMPYLTPYMTGRGRPTVSGPVDGDGRRSVYLAVRRNFLAPMFLAFDYPIPFTTIGRRSVSNVPAQALAMMNNPFVIEQARLWAARVLKVPDRSTADRVSEMYLTAFGRMPDQGEQQAALAFLGPSAGGSGSNELQSWADFAHVLFNVKEFIFLR
jgi:cytochrome c553